MDARRVGTVVKAVGSGASRRRVLGGLLGVLAGVAGLGVSEVQADKVGICHRSEDGSWHYIRVPAPANFDIEQPPRAVRKHLSHGDFLGASEEECEGLG